MRYELFLRRDEGLTAEEAAEATELAQAAKLHAELYEREGGPFGLDLGMGLDDPAHPAEKLCSVAFELAASYGLSVFDPQLGRVVAASEQEAIRERFAASASSLTGLAPSPRIAAQPVRTRFWLVLGGLLFVAVLAARALTCAVG